MLADQNVILEDSSICLKSLQFLKADCWSSLIFFISNTLTITKRRTWQDTLPSPFLVIFVRFLCCGGSYIVYIHFTLTVSIWSQAIANDHRIAEIVLLLDCKWSQNRCFHAIEQRIANDRKRQWYILSTFFVVSGISQISTTVAHVSITQSQNIGVHVIAPWQMIVEDRQRSQFAIVSDSLWSYGNQVQVCYSYPVVITCILDSLTCDQVIHKIKMDGPFQNYLWLPMITIKQSQSFTYCPFFSFFAVNGKQQRNGPSNVEGVKNYGWSPFRVTGSARNMYVKYLNLQTQFKVLPWTLVFTQN